MKGLGGDYLAPILQVEPEFLKHIDAVMVARVGREGVLERIANENEVIIERALGGLGIENRNDPGIIRAFLRKIIIDNETQILKYVDKQKGKDEFEKEASLAKKIARVGKGFFLKKDYGMAILEKRPPEHLMKFFGYKTVGELLSHHKIEEIFSALRFMESDEWMHETFEAAYSGFTPNDFEERDIELRVLGPEWHEVAEKFVAKKHHNVSHLKEFGVIFLNPIKEDIPGKFLRDFALLFHYFHEIEFYSKLFRRYATNHGFAERLKSLLRGDVKETDRVAEGEWLIVQRYLWKENPQDPRLFLPRVNPESMHWFRGERDIVELGEAEKDMKLALWQNLDWAGLVAHDDGGLVSFDLEDNAMAEVSAAEGKRGSFSYHQREALWTRIFAEYVGGEFEMEELLIENFERGSIVFPKLNFF